MLNYLVQNAIKDVWCSPQQDRQYIIKPFRLSRTEGALDYQKVMWERISLPTLDERYHVYQIGHIHPKLLGIVIDKKGWISLSSLVNESNLMSAVYFVDGQIIPRSLCFVRYDDQMNMVLAVKHHVKFPRLRTSDIFFRTYTNAFFESERADPEVDGTYVEGYTVTDNSSILHLQHKYNLVQTYKGHALAYINGYLVDDLNVGRISEGDYIEYVHDTSIIRVVDFKVSDLKVFNSVLDSRRKYLISYENDSNDIIEFEDDIDIYLFKESDNNRYIGTYYHHNKLDAIRMLTHRDYAIPVDYIQSYADTNDDWEDVNDLTLRFYIREAGLVKPLIVESNSVDVLYKLEHERIVGAMLGIDSTLDLWQASQLELSPYVKLMRVRTSFLDPSLVVSTYGYGAISKKIGDSPIEVDWEDGVGRIPLPFGLRSRITVYEYDAQGILLGYYTHSSGASYICNNPTTTHCELIAGFATNKLSASFGLLSHHLSPHISYRAYTCTLLGAGPVWDWVDVTDDETIVQRNGNTLSFDVDPIGVYTALVNDRDFVGYSLPLTQKNGIYRFTVSSMETHDDVEDLYITTIPPRTVEVWLNGHTLVEGIDFLTTWPEITIINKSYLIDGDVQQVVIRCNGFCNVDFTLDKPMDVGFIKHGVVGYSESYIVRNNVVARCSVGGMLKSVGQFNYHEDVVNEPTIHLPEGKPYVVNEIIVPLRGQVGVDTYDLRKLTIENNRKVGEYMGVNYDLYDGGDLPVVNDKHVVYSPFLARVINNVIEGSISNHKLKQHYSNSDVTAWLESEHYLLDVDPLRVGYDSNYVDVHPHRLGSNLVIDAHQRKFIQRVIDIYFDSSIDINDYVTVNAD